MQRLFYPDTVTIVRKKGDIFDREDIMTKPVLPDTRLTPEQNRSNVIARLRRDPSVFLVLEGRNGRCEESVDLSDGFSLTVIAQEGDQSEASIEVRCDGDPVLIEAFHASEFDSEIEDEMLGELTDRLSLLIGCIEDKDYSFLPDDCPYLTRVEPGEPVSFFEARRLLEEGGYQTESVHTVNYYRSPVLFAHENEIVLFGSHRFEGDEFYLEMKRLFQGVERNALLEAIKRVKDKGEPVSVIEWEDGSWSFRATMDDDLDKDNFLGRLESDLAIIRSFIGEIEDIVGPEPWSIVREQRQLFIYEVIDASLKYSKMKI